MATLIKSTSLDFNTIKTRLKDDLKKQTEFKDYDFEGSGLSNILDVLAYNTHLNGLTANFALNESFLNTAQLRSSVVSHAEALGYVPRSFTASQALLNLSVLITDANRPTSVTLPAGTSFTSTVAGVSYTFRTLEAFTGVDDGNGSYVFKTKTDSNQIPVFEGTQKTKTFIVGETSDSQIYVIPDTTADINSLTVRVFETVGGSTFESYTDLRKAIRIEPTSKHFQIKEVPSGTYELLFGDGKSTGKRPVAGNKVVVTYLSVVGATADGASAFTPSSQLTVDGSQYTINVVTDTVSAGGAFKESIESIRQNAPIYFASQQRLVTAEDYKAQILANFSAYLDDVIAWGGNDNVPVEYGNVYVGLKFKSGLSESTQSDVKTQIVNELTDNLAIMSISTEFVDPVETFLELQTFFNFDPDLTNTTARATENLVETTIQNFFATNLNKFGQVFRRSTILSQIDDLDVAILNSRMTVKAQQRITPITGQSLSYDINFPMPIATPDDVNRIVTSGRFVFNSRTCFIRNKLSSLKLEMVDIDGNVQVDNIGSYETGTGKVSLVGFNPTTIEGGSTLKISVTPNNESTIRPLRNFTLNLDTDALVATAQIDFQNTQLTL